MQNYNTLLFGIMVLCPTIFNQSNNHLEFLFFLGDLLRAFRIESLMKDYASKIKSGALAKPWLQWGCCYEGSVGVAEPLHFPRPRRLRKSALAVRYPATARRHLSVLASGGRRLPALHVHIRGPAGYSCFSVFVLPFPSLQSLSRLPSW